VLLYETRVQEGSDFLKHLDILKGYRDHLNKFSNHDFHISDTCFKAIVSHLLPMSWRTYIKPYQGNVDNEDDPDLKRCMTSDIFISLLHEEWRIHQMRERNGNEESFNLVGNQRRSTNLVTSQRAPRLAKSLKSQISDHKKDIQPYCMYCKKPGHWMKLCRKMLNNKCYNCGKPGHLVRDCRKPKKKKKKDESHQMIEPDMMFISEEALKKMKEKQRRISSIII
jgi:hypothetical protein